ncbi:MAG: hypothetical protein NTY53_18465 [Kiritimatiellaeota bacterium]|nr:hypothetical protein [Kiritimatiellota bacterium]
MRPSLLVIIMDFLVSSLLLFVSGPGSREEGLPRRGATRGPTAAETAPEFAPAAILDMEQQWAREYQQQLAETKISTQAETLSLMELRGRELTAARAQLESLVVQQNAELERKQQNLSQMSGALETLRAERERQEAALQATRQQAATLAEEKNVTAAAKAEIERKLQDAEARKQELAAQAAQLRQNLADQSALIHRQAQTLASQQQAIRDDLRNLTTSQTRIEGKTDAIQRGQSDMQNALAQFQLFASGLPKEWKNTAQQIAGDQSRLMGAVTGLTAMVHTQNPAQTGPEQQLVRDRIKELTDLNRDLTRQMTMLATNGFDGGALGAELRAVRQQQAQLQAGIGGLGSRLGEMETRQIGPFTKFRDARIGIRAALTAAKVGGINAPGPAPKSFSTTTYAPMVYSGDRFWLILHAGDLGVTWRDLDDDLDRLAFEALIPGVATAQPLHGPARPLGTDPRLVLLDLRQEPAVLAALSVASHVKPAALLGRAGLDKRGARDLYLFKRTGEGFGFAVELAPDLAQPGYLVLRSTNNRFINFLSTQLISTAAQRAEAGDYVVTAEGAVVGVMVDDQRAYVLGDADFAAGPRAVSLGTPRDFARDALELRKTLK